MLNDYKKKCLRMINHITDAANLPRKLERVYLK